MRKQGFIAIFIVTLIGLLAAIFTVASAERAYMQAGNATEAENVTSLRFRAISCINIARLEISLQETPVEGEYYTNSGNCKIETVNVGTSMISLKTSAEKDGTKISMSSKIDRNTFEIVSLEEIL